MWELWFLGMDLSRSPSIATLSLIFNGVIRYFTDGVTCMSEWWTKCVRDELEN